MKTAEEIIKKHLEITLNNSGVTELFAYKAAMEEYANQDKWINVDERQPEELQEVIFS